MLNLFIAILLENFDEGVLKQKMHEYEQQQQEKTRTNNEGLIQLTIVEKVKQLIKKMGQAIDDWLNPKLQPDDLELEDMDSSSL